MKNKFILSLLFPLLLSAAFESRAQLTDVAYTDGAQKFKGIVALPRSTDKKKAGVLILPAWMGIDVNAQLSAEHLAAEGYYSFIADIYGEGNSPNNDPAKARELSTYYKTHTDEYLKRIKTALNAFIETGADPNNIVIIGYCFGGTGALDAARANLPVKGVVSFHGGLARDSARPVGNIAPRVLVCHGAADPHVKEAEIKAFQNEMNKSNADWEMIYYANAVHAFTDRAAGNDPSKGAAYNDKAAKRSWALMLQFLKEVFEFS